MPALIDGAWDDLESWWGDRFGEAFLAHLNPGATTADLEALEAVIGRPLPDDFMAAYRRHDGQADMYEQDGEDKLVPGLLFGLPLMPIEAVIEELANWRALREELEADGSLEEFDEEQASCPSGHVKPVFANPFWVPFADDGGGNFLAMDLDPDTQGHVGQVINMGRDEDVKYVIAPSFGAFMRHLADELKRGNFSLVEDEPGEWALNIGEPEGTEHYFDALPVLYGDEAGD